MEYKWLFVGLGNPGDQYLNTRHNMGFLTVDRFLELAGTRKSMRLQLLRDVADYQLHAMLFAGAPCLLARPLTYMNLSGRAVANICGHHLIKPDQVVIMHDELDLELGRIKLKKSGGANGHNGVQSVTDCLNSGEFWRLRLGIGRPSQPGHMSDFVLDELSAQELELAVATVDRAVKGLEMFVRRGPGFAQQALHTPQKPEETEP
ncbi:MAG: aminoacyl-tRNA hydrolase [Proteobacteria bacterium]|nr:aminoacyl-tRNA hydrolase [Pseudomonadota bacterium]MBU1611708.1 aminoacyl-tRNA hydrolase [Pseudomonadota bacterium]